MMSEQLRLHPVSILLNLLLVIRHSIVIIVISFISFSDEYLHYFIFVSLILLILLTSYSVLRWYRFTYRVQNGELQIKHGILIRRKRYISINRIQSIDLTAGIAHRIFKLVKVEIETAGSGEGAEASLNAVKITEGEQLRSRLKSANTSQFEINEETPIDNQPCYRISFKRLFLAGSTSGSIGVILAIAAFGFSELEQFIPGDFYDNTIEWAIGLSLVFLIGLTLIVLIILWIFGIAGTMIKYGNFTITKDNDELFITRGLLEKKQLTIPLNRIQAVGIEESIIRQPLGYVTVFAEVAGGSMDTKEEFPVLFPIMKADEVEDFLETLLPRYASGSKELRAPPKRARKFYLIRAMLPVIILGIGMLYFFPSLIWALIFLLFISFYLGILRYTDAGYHLGKERIILRYRGMLTKTTMVIYHKRVQAFVEKQHKIQKIQKLSTVKISIIGSLGTGTHYKIKDLNKEDAIQIADWYSYR